MKRKYLSALLMGALTVTSVSTFTSCKDYDSDISNLQGQIDKAALKTEVEAMKTTVEAAKTAAESAKTTAEKNATDLTDVKAKAEKLATQVAEALQTGKDAKAAADEAKDQCDELELKFFEYYTAEKVDALLDELEAKIDANTESIKDLKAEVESYSSNINKLYSAVTGVYLMNVEGVFNTKLDFTVGTVAKDYVFGEKEVDDLKGEHSADPTYAYVKKAQFSRPEEILVRVNPVNATLTKDMIKFVDSKGGDLSSMIEVESVSKYDEYLTTSTRASETGLWRVQLQLKKPYNAKAVPQVDGTYVAPSEPGGTDNNKYILFAAAVNNTANQSAEGAEDRWVVSDYQLTVGGTTSYSATTQNLDNVTVNGAKVSSVGNLNDGTHVTTVQNGEDIVVSFADVALNKQVDRFYVVRDDKHASSSGSSEINAWNKYSYEGLNEVVAVENGAGKATLRVTIPSDAKKGDEVQFRIFAVNYDGTLVEQNGRAFRVYVGAETTTASVAGSASFTGYQKLETEWLQITGSLKDGDNENNALVKNEGSKTVTLTNGDGASVTVNVAFAKDDKGTAAAKDSEIKYVKFTLDESGKTTGQTLCNWPNEGTLTGTIVDGNSPAFNSISVSLKKSMPTAEEAAALVYKKVYSWKSGQLAADSTYTAYMYPAAELVADKNAQAVWNTQAGTAYKYMTEAILGLNDQLSISMATAGDSYEVTGSSEDDYVFNLAASDFGLIDNKTKHESTVYYNFGKISSNETIYNEEGEDYVVPVQSYKTIFACPLHEDVQTYAWAEAATGCTKDETTGKYTLTYSKLNEITYGEDNWSGTVTVYKLGTDSKTQPTTESLNVLKFLNATNKFNNTLFGGDLCTHLFITMKYTEVVKVTLTSDDNQAEDYFSAKIDENNLLKFTPKKTDNNSNPSQNVASHLNITVKDAFGHQHVISVPFTVKRQ